MRCHVEAVPGCTGSRYSSLSHLSDVVLRPSSRSAAWPSREMMHSVHSFGLSTRCYVSSPLSPLLVRLSVANRPAEILGGLSLPFRWPERILLRSWWLQSPPRCLPLRPQEPSCRWRTASFWPRPGISRPGCTRHHGQRFSRHRRCGVARFHPLIRAGLCWSGRKP